MDPDEALKTLRDSAESFERSLTIGIGPNGEHKTEDTASALLVAEDAFEAFKALDTWLSNAGFLPAAWQSTGAALVCDNALPDGTADDDLPSTDQVLAKGIEVPTDWQMYSIDVREDEEDFDGLDHDAIVTEAVRKIAARVGTDITNPTQLVAAVIDMCDNGGLPAEIMDTEPRWDLERWMVHVCQVMQWDADLVKETL